MENWVGRVAVVMNAHNAFGRAICQELLKYRLKVVSCDIQYTGENSGLCKIIKGENPGELYLMRYNLLGEGAVNIMFDDIESLFDNIRIFISIAELPEGPQVVSARDDRSTALQRVLETCLRKGYILLSDRGILIYVASTAPPHVSELEFRSLVQTVHTVQVPLCDTHDGVQKNLQMKKIFVPPVDPETRPLALLTTDFVYEVIRILTFSAEL